MLNSRRGKKRETWGDDDPHLRWPESVRTPNQERANSDRGLVPAALTRVERARLRRLGAEWRQHRADPQRGAEIREFLIGLRARGVRRQDIAIAVGAATTTVDHWITDRQARRPACEQPMRRDPTTTELRRLSRMLARVPYDGRRCAWMSPEGRQFITSARKVVDAGVPVMRLAAPLARNAPVGEATISERLGVSGSGSIRPSSGVRRAGRERKAPDMARVPLHTRPVTFQEWTRLLSLHSAVPIGAAYAIHTTEERAELTAPVRARDAEILRLWADRVADAHIADLLGLSDYAIAAARRRARRVIGTSPTRSPIQRRHQPNGAAPD